MILGLQYLFLLVIFKAVNIGETILNSINESLFLKVTEHIKNEFT